jgi:hypothetical protein
MTWLGKILTFVVLIASVVWMYLNVQAYVTQTNWKTALEKWKVQLDASENLRKVELARYQASEDALKRQIVNEQTRSTNLQKELSESQTANKNIAAKMAEQQKAFDDFDTKTTLLQANVDGTLKELNTVRERSNTLEDKMADQILKAESAKKEMITAQNDARLARSIAEDLGKKNEELTEKISDLKLGGSLLGSQFSPKIPPVPSNLRGEVENVNERRDFVTLSIGADAGLSIGSVLQLERIAGGGQYLGTVRIFDLQAKKATATFTPKRSNVPISQLRPDELPKKGDQVRPTETSRLSSDAR